LWSAGYLDVVGYLLHRPSLSDLPGSCRASGVVCAGARQCHSGLSGLPGVVGQGRHAAAALLQGGVSRRPWLCRYAFAGSSQAPRLALSDAHQVEFLGLSPWLFSIASGAYWLSTWPSAVLASRVAHPEVIRARASSGGSAVGLQGVLVCRQ